MTLVRGRADPQVAAVHDDPATTAGDTVSVAGWTAVSRVSGVVRVLVIGAVLGPTYFGNTYQFTNTLPNVLYYGFLAGSLVSSLLVPAVVGHVDAGDARAAARVAGGFLGTALLGLLLVGPGAVLAAPALLAATGSGPQAASQGDAARLLAVLTVPQVLAYGVVATSAAVMNAHRRFALAAAAPALENVGVVAVLLVTALVFGPGTGDGGQVPTAEVLLLGAGSTLAVVLHAGVQWWGARRLGVTVRPRAGWRDPEVRRLLRRAVAGTGQAGLVGLQLLALLVVANRVSGGVVAYQAASNFLSLPVALLATPIALALLPRLARHHQSGRADLERSALGRGYGFVLFLAVPAAVGYVLLAGPLAAVVSAGRMATPDGIGLVAAAVAAVALAMVGQSVFLVGTFASYARDDSVTPLRAMVVQAAVTGLGLVPAFLVHGRAVVVAVGLAYSAGSLVGAADLVRRGARAGSLRPRSLLAPLLRSCAGAAAMVPPVVLVVGTVLPSGVPGAGRGQAALAVVAGVGAGVIAFLAVQGLLRAPELGWLSEGVGDLRRRRGRSEVAP